MGALISSRILSYGTFLWYWSLWSFNTFIVVKIVAFRDILFVLPAGKIGWTFCIYTDQPSSWWECEILLQQMPSKRTPCHPFSTSLQEEWLQWSCGCDCFADESDERVHSEKSVDLSGLFNSKSLGSAVISLSNSCSICKWKQSFTWIITSLNKERLRGDIRNCISVWELSSASAHFN